MRLLISFDKYQENWYVGELYHAFFKYLNDTQGIDVEYCNIKDLSLKYPPVDDRYSSIFSIFNLIVTNKNTNKTFIHSLSDHAPSMMDDTSGINNFDISAFSCSSSLTQDLFNVYSKKYLILPSFYMLENFSDLNLVEKYKENNEKINKGYFNGLCYGERGRYRELLKNSSFFDFKDKSNPTEYETKEDYYKKLSYYRFGLSFNGAAKICYRDVEYFGMGILSLREKLETLTRNPILPNVHYINFFDEEIKTLLYDINSTKILKEKIEDKFNSLITEDYSDIIENSKKWYENNCKIDKQINTLKSLLIESETI